MAGSTVKGVLYYASRYKSTGTVSSWIAAEIKGACMSIVKIGNETEFCTDFDFYLFGCPVFIGKPMEEMREFINRNKKYLSNKVFFSFLTSWAQSTSYREECGRFLELMESDFKPYRPRLIKSLPGKLIMEGITSQDREIMERLLRRIRARSLEFRSQNMVFEDQTNEEESRAFGKEINEWIWVEGNMF